MPTWPGINPSFDKSGYSREQRGIIERLAQYFYLTRALDPICKGNSIYRAFLMRPADGISTILNVEREVAVLFADYETFEARTLTAYEEIYDQFDDGRVDKTVRILISRDNGIVQKVKHYLEKDPEYPVIIPYTYDQFESRTDNFITAAMRANYLTRDLFGYQSPLKQEHFFFGRGRLIGQVLDIHRSGQNSSLFGLRKSGKTSTIYAIQRRAKALGCRSVSIDCQDPAVHAKTYGELLLLLVNEVRRAVNMKLCTAPFGDRPDQVSENFREVMTSTLSNVKSDVLIIFDEIENISPKTAASPHWRSGSDTILFWQTLRAFFQRSGKYKLTFCFVGTNPHLFETPRINDVDNPVYMFAPKTFLPPLSLDDVKEMCDRLGYFMGLDFDHPIVNQIHQRFGGHPFFVRQLCSGIHHCEPLTRPIAVSREVCRRAEQEGAGATRNYVREILYGLRNFYPEEYELLQHLARGELEFFNEVTTAYPEFIEHLIGYGIITQRGTEYEFLFEAVRDALLGSDTLEGGGTTEAKRTEISARRNRLEEEIRTALFYWSKSLTEAEWDNACETCIPKQLARVGRLGRRRFFSRTNSPLYFLDLMKFVDHTNVFYSEGIDPNAIRAAFDTVNKSRIDAHAGAISDEKYGEWLHAISALEDIFLPPD